MKAANDNKLKRFGPWVLGRAQAKTLKTRFYTTGEPCKTCGGLDRYTCDSKCATCRIAYCKARYDENAEEIKRKAREAHFRDHEYNLERMRQYSKDNREARLPYRKEYNEKNRERMNLYSRAWHSDNKDRAADYRRKNLELYAAHARNRRTLKTTNGGAHTKDDVTAILRRQKFKCAECGVSVRKRENRHVDHIMPLALGGSNAPSNLQVLCPPCNLSKGALHPIDFANRRGRLL